MNKPFVIAIDGPAASGKGSLAKNLAKELGFDFLDTGALYRRVALFVLNAGINPDDTHSVISHTERFKTQLNEPYDDNELRNDHVGDTASKVAQIPEIRALLLDFQQNFAQKAQKGAVLDGRDIATVICPNADLKLFITASSEKRAERRTKELQLRGLEARYEAVLAEMQERDERDKPRLDEHLDPQINNHVIDTSDISPEDVLKQALDLYHSVTG
ncbi:MAG: (d)CMP kinase [Pseudomonadota bacterium]